MLSHISQLIPSLHIIIQNRNFRTAVWTGEYLQMTLMCIPAGTWHNIVNVGESSLRAASVYAPPHHPKGTVHRTKEEAERAEGH